MKISKHYRKNSFPIYSLLYAFILTGLISSCGSSRKLISKDEEIDELYQQGRYEEVIQKFDHYEASRRKPGDTLAPATIILAGLASYESGKYDQVHRYFEKTELWKSSPNLIYKKGLSYQKTGRLEEEYLHWTSFISTLEGTDYQNDIYIKIYDYEYSIKDYQKADKTWKHIDHKEEPSLMFKQLIVLEYINKREDALMLCEQILKLAPEYEPARFWKARYYFEKAENWYQAEMAKYNKNPEYTAYAYLRRELRKISADFRTSRDVFEELHKINPDNITYMQFLKNIYIRLEMKNEAAKMEKLINNDQ